MDYPVRALFFGINNNFNKIAKFKIITERKKMKTQLELAREGIITDPIKTVAASEGLPAEAYYAENCLRRNSYSEQSAPLAAESSGDR